MGEYRGVERPKVQGSGNHWVINDGAFGYFTSSTRQHVESRWEDAVNSSLQRNALDAGDYHISLDFGDWTCGKCGARIADPWIHNDWHVRLDV